MTTLRGEKMEIRLAEDKDLPAIKDCIKAAYTKYIPRIGKKPDSMEADFSEDIEQEVVHVATAEKNLKGLIILIPKKDHVLLKSLAVHPNSQGQGIGRALMDFAINYAKSKKLNEIQLYTNELMTENLNYYPKFGFVEVDRREEDGYKRVYMIKYL